MVPIHLKSHPWDPHLKPLTQQGTAPRGSREQVTQDLSSEFSPALSLVYRKKVSCWESRRSVLKAVLGEWLVAELAANTRSPTSLFSSGFCSSES